MNQNELHIINSLQKQKTEIPSDNYFAALKTALLEKADRETKVIPLYRKWWVVSSAAASIVFIVVFSLFFRKENRSSTQPDWDSVSREEMYAYVENNIQDFETETIADQLNEVPGWDLTISVTGTSAKQKENVTQLFDELDEEEILEYLQEDVVEMDDESITGY